MGPAATGKFSKTRMLSKSSPLRTAESARTLGNGVWESSRRLASTNCRSESSRKALRPTSRRRRMGSVLMKRPTAPSTYGSSGGRPAMVMPNTTSSVPA